MNLKEAYPGSLGRAHFFSDLTRDAVTVSDLAVSASKLSSYTCYLVRIDHVFCFFGILSIPDFLKTDFLYSKQSVNTVFKKRWALSKLEKYGKF